MKDTTVTTWALNDAGTEVVQGETDLGAPAAAPGPRDTRRRMRDEVVAIALESMGQYEVDWILEMTHDERLRDLAQAEADTRAVERAVAESTRLLEAIEWGQPLTELATQDR
jgi:hypothetical protein